MYSDSLAVCLLRSRLRAAGGEIKPLPCPGNLGGVQAAGSLATFHSDQLREKQNSSPQMPLSLPEDSIVLT